MSKSKALRGVDDKLLAGSHLLEFTLSELVARGNPVSVLEIECGSGRALMELAWEFRNEEVRFHGHTASRGDPLADSGDLLRTADDHGIGDDSTLRSMELPGLHFGDPTRLDLPDDSIDLVYVPSVVRYLARKAELLEEILRVLAPGGVAFVRISGEGWDHPHCEALPEPELSGNPCRFLIRHGNEIVPLEAALALAGERGLEFEMINLPACVVRLSKRAPGPVSLGLRFDDALTLPLRTLRFREATGRVKQGGIRSVYEIDADAYRRLVELGLISDDRREPAGATRTRGGEPARDPEEDREQLERNRRILAGFEVGQRVKIRGRLGEDRTFRADKVRINEDEANREALEGPIEKIDAEAGSLEVLGLPIDLGRIERIKSCEGGKYELRELVPGMHLKLKGRTSDGRFRPEKVKVIQGGPSTPQEIQAFIGAIDLAHDRFDVGHLTVAIDAATKMEEA